MDYSFRRSPVDMLIVTGLLASGCVELELAAPRLEESKTEPLANHPKLPWARAPELEGRSNGGEFGFDFHADADANSVAPSGCSVDNQCVDALVPEASCSSASVCDAGTTGDVAPLPVPLCNGCVALSFPANAPRQAAIIQFSYPEPGRDFSVGVATWRLLVPSESMNEEFSILAFAKDSQMQDATTDGFTPLSAGNVEADTWWDYTLDLSTYPPATSDAGVYTFDNKHVRVLGLIVAFNWRMNASARILVDSVSFPAVSGLSEVTFGTGLDRLVLDLSIGASDAHLEHFPEQ